MSGNVFELKTYTERDEEQMARMLSRITSMQKEGKIKELVIVYLDEAGTTRAELSDSTRMSTLSFFIEYLRTYLSDWIRK